MSLDRKAPWRRPTRRGFLTALGLGGLGAVVLPKIADDAAPRADSPAALPRWIGHF